MDLFKRIQDLSAIYDDDGPSAMVQERPMFNDGGMLVQPSNDGSRPGYAKITEKGKSTPKGGRPIPENIVMADDTKAIKELQNKVDKLNRVNKLDDKGIKFKLIKTQAGNYTTELSYLAKDYREAIGKNRTTGKLTNLIEEFNQFKKTDLFKNYSKSATMKAGGVKSAKKQLADIGSKKEDVFNYLLNNKNASIEEIAKNLKLKEGVVRTNLQGLYTDIYKRTADQGAVYLKDFNTNQLDSVHSSIKNTKVPLKDRVKNLVIDAYKGDKNLKPILEKLDNFYTLQSEIKKTPYGKFFAANLDHPVPLNFIRQLEEGADPFNLIKIRPIPEFLNQRAFKAQFDRVLGTAYRTGNKKALEAIVNVQSYLPQEFGGITPDGKIKDYGAKPFSLKTDLTQSNFGDIYKRVFEFIKNPELQKTFKESKVSFKNLASQEKNIMKQVKGIAKKLADSGFECRLANGLNCNDPRAYTQSIKENMARVQQGDDAAILKVNKLGKSMNAFRGAAKFTGWGLLTELGFAAPLAAIDYAKGANKDEIISNATYGLLGKSEEEQLKEKYADYGKAKKFQDTYDNLLAAEKSLDNVGGYRSIPVSQQKIKDLEKKLIEQSKPFNTILPPSMGFKGDFDLDMFFNAQALDQKRRKEFLKEKEMRSQERKTDPFIDPFQAAGGGIAKMAGDRSGPPPQSGPNSQGLQGLFNRAMKIKE